MGAVQWPIERGTVVLEKQATDEACWFATIEYNRLRHSSVKITKRVYLFDLGRSPCGQEDCRLGPGPRPILTKTELAFGSSAKELFEALNLPSDALLLDADSRPIQTEEQWEAAVNDHKLPLRFRLGDGRSNKLRLCYC